MKTRRKYHANLPGFVFTVATIFLGAGAFNSQNNLLFLFFGFAISSMVASGLISGAMLMRVRVERLSVSRARAGGEVILRYRLRNSSKRAPAFALSVQERGDEGWSRLVSMPSGFVPHIAPAASEIVTVRCRALARGVGELSQIEVASRFPFGFMRKSVVVESRSTLVVHPEVRELRDDALKSIASRERGAVLSRHERGTGGEFYSLREYAHGDPPSTVAWRASARHRALLVREETRLGSRAYDILLVLSGDPDEQDADERAISLAASIANKALSSGLPISVSVPGYGVSIGRESSRGQLARVLDALAGIDLRARKNEHRSTPRGVEHDTRTGTVFAIHATGIDPSAAPRDALHLRGEDLDRLALQRRES